MTKRVGYVLAVSAIAFGLAAPPAMASYNNWGILSAYEGSTLVAQGKGTIGVDFNLDVIGGHVGSRDPRPGGSPAFARIQYFYEQPSSSGPYNLRGSNNSTSTWIDQFKNGNLNTSYTQAKMNAAACQDDSLGPDACKQTNDFNFAWP